MVPTTFIPSLADANDLSILKESLQNPRFVFRSVSLAHNIRLPLSRKNGGRLGIDPR